MDQQWAKYIIGFGVLIVVIGLVIYFFGDKLSWFGRLPGDIRIERENSRIYIPITTMLLCSLLLTIILNLIKRWF